MCELRGLEEKKKKKKLPWSNKWTNYAYKNGFSTGGFSSEWNQLIKLTARSNEKCIADMRLVNC